MSIRRATIDDLATLQALGEQTYREHFQELWTEPWLNRFLEQDFSDQALRHSLQDNPCTTWLLTLDEDDLPCGFAKVNWQATAPIPTIASIELQKIYLTRHRVGTGMGRRLLGAVIDLARVNGHHSIWLEVLKTNTKAQQFYTSMGFEYVGEIPYATDLYEIGMRVLVKSISPRG
ncbi:GNAT family N-acetyltransferase [Chitinivorax sp. B]|uniref:GNAT family N-acetyltransferase n=1 Tax=Chitinivorax sp. B TaxID=2502235 RepID=UPI0010F6A133|nr:GNAT family N-acetyltransferase [Chitinivorax sp. B]